MTVMKIFRSKLSLVDRRIGLKIDLEPGEERVNIVMTRDLIALQRAPFWRGRRSETVPAQDVEIREVLTATSKN